MYGFVRLRKMFVFPNGATRGPNFQIEPAGRQQLLFFPHPELWISTCVRAVGRGPDLLPLSPSGFTGILPDIWVLTGIISNLADDILLIVVMVFIYC